MTVSPQPKFQVSDGGWHTPKLETLALTMNEDVIGCSRKREATRWEVTLAKPLNKAIRVARLNQVAMARQSLQVTARQRWITLCLPIDSLPLESHTDLFLEYAIRDTIQFHRIPLNAPSSGAA